MRLIQLLFLLTFFSCKPQLNELKIDTSVKKEMELNKKVDESSDLIKGNNSYFIFSSKEMNKLFGKKDSIQSIEKMLSNTNEILQPNVCACQLKNDTITISGGIFYAGGIGYQIKIHKNKFDGKIILASTSKIHKKEKEGEFINEIHLNSEKQELLLVEKPIFELDKRISGKMAMESYDFFTQKDDALVKDKYWMKIVFECKLNKHGPL